MGGGYKNKVTSQTKKTLKVVALTAVITATLTGGIAVAAVNLTAKDIGFTSTDGEWKVDTVEDAMNDLYDITKTKTNKPIFWGTKEAPYSSTQNTVDLTDIPNYKELVLYETLWPVAKSISYYQRNGSFSTNVNYTYDAENGVLSFTGSCMNPGYGIIDIYYIP